MNVIYYKLIIGKRYMYTIIINTTLFIFRYESKITANSF